MGINSRQFSNCWAVILGGSSGFGLAAVEKLAQHGMNIAVLHRDTSLTAKSLKETFTNLAAQHQVTILPYNINALDAAGRQQFVDDFLKTDKQAGVKLLLHSIARGNLKPLVTGKPGDETLLTAEDIQHTTYAMSNSLLDWVRLLMDNQLFHADARVIGLTSEGAHKYWDCYGAVALAKTSLESLAAYLAVETAKFGIKTNIIQAGITATPSLMKIPNSDKLVEFATKRNPMGRMTTPADVANAIYLLCQDEASWINGALIHVDGGEHCR